MRKIGLHLRLCSSLTDLARYALSLQLPIFQCFFIHQETYQMYEPTDIDIRNFLTHYRNKFEQLYLHGSYWINLASYIGANKILLKELELAKKLAFNYIVLHPGSVKKSKKEKQQGIEIIARNLNALLKRESSIKIILENTAHGGSSIGGDLEDFVTLRNFLDHPEKIGYCIDTAHAFVFGYDLTNDQLLEEFWVTIQKTIGIDHLSLIHLNDTLNECNSYLDKHEKVGSGLLASALHKMVQYTASMMVPIILELPKLPETEELTVLSMVRKWAGVKL